jgi:diguanylate cyclase
VHYQPKVDLQTGDVHSVEALVRWDHPTLGLLYPDQFLDLVEEAGLMRSLTQVVMQIALDQVATWCAQGQRLTVAVNLSASSLVDADLPDEVAAMLATRNLSPSLLQLEITEEFLMADELKLDRSFVVPMTDDARAAALVAATVALAHSLGLRMVAEGVEDEVAYTELARLGCDQGQGYFMSRPVPAVELDRWLRDRLTTGVIPEQRRPSPGTQTAAPQGFARNSR